MMKNRLFIFLLIGFFIFNACKSDKKDEVQFETQESNYSSLLDSDFLVQIDSSFYEDSLNLFPPSAFFDGGSKYEKTIDKNGIPLHTLNEKEYYHPSQVASYGLDLYFEYYKTKNEAVKTKFLKQAAWLSNHVELEDSFAVWKIPFDNESFLIDAPYGSALTNSWCAGVLLMASQFENQEKYFELSKKALNYMFVPLENGGGLSQKHDGSIWFEEYPSIENTSSVLNGYLFSMDILHLFYEVTNDAKYDLYLNKAISSLETNLDLYNLGYGSIYDLFLKVNKLGAGYQKLHWIQLLWVYQITGNEKFFIVAKEFYEQTTQNDYLITSDNCIDCERHGINLLNQNKFWYGSWSARDKKIKIDIDLQKKQDLYRINFYSVSEENFPDSLMLCFDNDNCHYLNLKNNKLLGYNSHKQHETFVKSIVFNKLQSVNKVEFTFFNPSRKIIALRNLGIQVMKKKDFFNEFSEMNTKLIWNNRKSFNTTNK